MPLESHTIGKTDVGDFSLSDIAWVSKLQLIRP